ncbi:MAG: 4Fe-4S dicluster domain-containing protein [Rhodospirillales bacterium]|nr:4Fe-4S dicluster domain-containing protein [Rhodospirillales bacterium]
MAATKTTTQKAFVMDADKGLQKLISALAAEGYQVIGPKNEDGAIIYDRLDSAKEMPTGLKDEQDGGQYRLVKGRAGVYFDYVVGPHTWKRYLFPPEQKICQMRRQGKAFRIVDEPVDIPKYAFIGVRSCEIAAMQVQDKVFDNGMFADPAYLSRREVAFVVAVNCTRAAGTCFCASMNTGPKAKSGFDIALTEISDKSRHVFVVEAGSPRGEKIVAKLKLDAAADKDVTAADGLVKKAARNMGREMVAEVGPLLKRNLEHRQWDEVAKRCLSCANCTLVCPTCFCNTVEDVTDLTGSNAERWRRWDSCFTMDFSYIHGGSVRREGASRYRQWMTHKLSSWHDQFETSGCVGCGRCITWCPVGIDITEEAREIQKSEGRA